MTEESRTESTESGESRQRWVKDLQAALDRTGNAVRTAWEATRDNRVSALESAKQAARELGEVLEKGMEAARERWETESAREGGEEEGRAETPAAEAPPFTPEPPPPGTEPPSPPGDVPPPEEHPNRP